MASKTKLEVTGPGDEFRLDRFQIQAIAAFDAGESVLVAAPTGAGKTVVAEHALAATLAEGRHSFYTSPIKALANQKFRDFCERFGTDSVGLLTGDLTVRGSAPIVVMTTEVLRNMLYEQSARLSRLGCVVLDEVHYLADRHRGPVWEEVLLNLPSHVATVSLSATVSNLDEFVEWLRHVRGDTTLVVEYERPVPLDHRFAAGSRGQGGTQLVPLLDRGRLSEKATRFLPERRSGGKGSRSGRGRGGAHNRHRGGPPGSGRNQRGSRPDRPWKPPRRPALVPQLVAMDLGPLIWFIFSRAGCDEALEQCVRAGLSFTDSATRDRLIEILNETTADIDDESWYRLGLDTWQDGFEAGIATHHAGLVPAAKEAVEVAFAEGLIQVVFATETLAMGVNLPARTVVIEKLIKFDGEDHKALTPMEFTQLTGRAGRRGIDDHGSAVTCWNQRMSVDRVAELATSTDYPLRSAFNPNYNMVANLMRRADHDAARRFVARSFAQFQIDRSILDSDRGAIDLERQLDAARADLVCDLGDVRAALRPADAARLADDAELAQLRPGDVLGERGGMVVLTVANRGSGTVVSAQPRQGEAATIRAGDLAAPITTVGRIKLPGGVAPGGPQTKQWAIAELTEHWADLAQPVELCPRYPEHRAALNTVEKLERQVAKGRARRDRRSGALEQRFDAVADIMTEHGFARDWALTDKGRVLAQVHGDCEIVVAEAVAEGAWDRLEPPELAAVLSVLTQQRRVGPVDGFGWPSKAVRRSAHDLIARTNAYRDREYRRLGFALTAEPDAQFVSTVYGWATGLGIDAVLPEEMTGGDFVRSIRQVIDLARQVSQTGIEPLASIAAEAVFCLDHGLVRSRRDLATVETADPEPDESGLDSRGD